MLRFILWRALYAIPTLFLISLLSFAIIQLPPGDFLSNYAASLAASGETVSPEVLEALRAQYGLGEPFYVQYLKWIVGIAHGDFGLSMEWRRPVSELIWERTGLSLVVALGALILTWIIAIPVGILSAVRQYSIADYVATVIGFVGLAIPNFLLALLLMVAVFELFGASVGGLFSPEYQEAAWSLGRVLDLLTHLWLPVLVVGLSQTAVMIRVMRANLLDELRAPYVTAARAMGLSERELLLRFPVRVAMNPFVSTIGWALPELISGVAIVSIVLSLPTTGPLLLQALVTQDMYLAGAFILLLGVLTIIGTLISDLLLAWLDPRVRLEQFSQ